MEVDDGNRTGVYCILCLKNNKRYVGSTGTEFNKRWYEHRRDLRIGDHCNSLLRDAWARYGEASFLFLVLEFCDPVEKIDREQWFIDLFESANPEYGFNIAPNAASSLGCKMPIGTGEKIAAKTRGRKKSEQERGNSAHVYKWFSENVSGYWKGKKFSPESVEKRAATHRGKKRTPEQRKRMSEGRRLAKLKRQGILADE